MKRNTSRISRTMTSGATIAVAAAAFFASALAQAPAQAPPPVPAQAAAPSAASPSAATVRVDASPAHVINSFDPDQAIGSSIDNLSKNAIDKVYTPHIIQEALSAGY